MALRRKGVSIALVAGWLEVGCGVASLWGGSTATGTAERALGFLDWMMDRYHLYLDVYTDAGSAGNHFLCLARMPEEGSGAWIDVCFTGSVYSGGTAIECGFRQEGSHWGGFYFLNGVIDSGERTPRQNWGDVGHAGLDLRGASRLTFWARGRDGGERVEFFCGGVGWSVDYKGRSVEPVAPFPDSFPKASSGFIRLSSEWQQYSIELQGQDLSYVIGGFGWVVDKFRNRGHDEVVFYVDDIRYDLARTNDLRLMCSFDTRGDVGGFDNIMRNVAFVYDNAVALIAYLAEGSEESRRRAGILADSLVYAVYHDRATDGPRLRNAYMGGDLQAFPGWRATGKQGRARLPNFWDCGDQQVYEDRMAISTYAGNVAWAMLALLSAYRHLGETRYLECAEDLGRWIIENCRDERGAGGFLSLIHI